MTNEYGDSLPSVDTVIDEILVHNNVIIVAFFKSNLHCGCDCVNSPINYCALYKDSASLIFSFVDIVTMISKSSGNEN